MKKPDPVIDLLRSVPGLRHLNNRSLGALVRLVDQHEFAPGEVLTREGVSGRQAFVVLDGEGEVYIDGELVTTVGPGEFIGEMAMLDHGPRCATVRAKTAMHVLVIGPQAFSTFVDEPGVSRAMATLLSQRLRAADAAAIAD